MSVKFSIGELVRLEGMGPAGMVDYVFEDRVFVRFPPNMPHERDTVMEYTSNELEPVVDN